MSEPLPDTAEILERAAARARESNLAYAGAVTPAEAHALIQSGAARLIDVRTRFENEYVGRVPNTVLIEWKAMGAPGPNPDFLTQLAQAGSKQDNYLFLCRSGVRSHAAAVAATQAGYSGAFNILEGFEGDLDAEGHRGSKGGWRKSGLPWVQS
jgi:rhodanese-related sulfurtransferase